MALKPLVFAERMLARTPRAGRTLRGLPRVSPPPQCASRRLGGGRHAGRADAAARRREVLSRRLRELAPQPASLLDREIAGMAALVVDDLPIYRHAIRRILQPVADRVYVADDGLEALEQLRRSKAGGEPIDIVLTDMHMPVMDGLELICRMRSAGDDTPVVVLTTDPSEELRLTVERFARTAVAIKPVDAADLMNMISVVRRG